MFLIVKIYLTPHLNVRAHTGVELTPISRSEPDSGRGLHRRGSDVHDAAALRDVPRAAGPRPPRHRRLRRSSGLHHGGNEGQVWRFQDQICAAL